MNEVYRSKHSKTEIRILRKALDKTDNRFIYKVLNGMNIGYIGQISEEELNDKWELIKEVNGESK